jgi:hypothetical protein
MRKSISRSTFIAVTAILAACACPQQRTSLAAVQDAVAADRVRAELMQNDIKQATSTAKLAISEFWISNGLPPADNRSAGIPEPNVFRGETLKRMTVLPGGLLELVFDEKSGVSDGIIRLIPNSTEQFAMGVRWGCTTPSYKDIEKILPACVYKP